MPSKDSLCLAMYDEIIASANFVVSKRMDYDVMRMMWFYGVDHGHSFFHDSGKVRYKAVTTAFLSALPTARMAARCSSDSSST